MASSVQGGTNALLEKMFDQNQAEREHKDRFQWGSSGKY